jgi:FlaG/FlaF family flagellin (archaellin)
VEKMKSLARNEKALSTVVTTLIILVVSILLAGVVTMYAINIISTRTQQEELRLSNRAVWVYANGTAFAAVAVDNIGGRDVVIDKVQVRGVESEWSTVHYLRRSTPVASSLNCPNETHTWTGFLYTSGTVGDFTVDSTDLPLASGDTIVLYISNPDSLISLDVGHSIGITIFTMNAQYYTETNAKSAETA